MRNYVIKAECKLYSKNETSCKHEVSNNIEPKNRYGNSCTTIDNIPSIILNYCSFSLSTERANNLIPLGLHNIEIHEQPIYRINSKIFDAQVSIPGEEPRSVFRLKHHLNIKQEVDEWLISIDASNIKYFDKITLTSNDIRMDMHNIYIHAIGMFDIEHVNKSTL